MNSENDNEGRRQAQQQAERGTDQGLGGMENDRAMGGQSDQSEFGGGGSELEAEQTGRLQPTQGDSLPGGQQGLGGAGEGQQEQSGGARERQPGGGLDPEKSGRH